MKNLLLPNLKAIVAFVISLVALTGFEVPETVVEPLTALIIAIVIWLTPNQK